jgi:hypothetical protein
METATDGPTGTRSATGSFQTRTFGTCSRFVEQGSHDHVMISYNLVEGGAASTPEGLLQRATKNRRHLLIAGGSGGTFV